MSVRAAAPRNAAGKLGEMVLRGGSDGEDGYAIYADEEMMLEEMYGGSDLTTIPELIKSFRTAQKNDEIRSTVRFRGTRATHATLDLDEVVSGFAMLPIFAVR